MGTTDSKNKINENISVNTNLVSEKNSNENDKENLIKIIVISFVVTLITLIMVRKARKYWIKKVSEISISRV
jgi:cytoskeletal protein RodZ